GSPVTATLTIAGQASVQFAAATYTVQAGNSVDIIVSRTGNTTITRAACSVTSDAATGTVTFAPNQTTQTFSLPTSVFIDTQRTVALTLSNASPGTQLGSPASATLTVIGQASVQFADATYTVQSGGYVDLIVSRTGNT